MFEKLSRDIGIDLGTANVLVYVKGKGVVIREPSVVAIDMTTDKVVKIGAEAANMLGRTPENINAVRPLKDGVVSQYEVTLQLLKYFIRRASDNTVLSPKVMICVPSGISDVEERAVIDAAHDAGARKTYLVEEPVAAAVGAGLDINSTVGRMIVDIGGGITQIAVISLGGIVVSESIKIGGDKFDEAIMQYVRRKYNLLIGQQMAEQIKKDIGIVYDHDVTVDTEAKGRDIKTGMPRSVIMNSREMMEVLMEPITAILDAVCSVIERTPPELVCDILNNGITMVGGGSKLQGFDKLIERVTDVRTSLASDPENCVINGTGKMLDQMKNMPEGTVNISRDRKNRY